MNKKFLLVVIILFLLSCVISCSPLGDMLNGNGEEEGMLPDEPEGEDEALPEVEMRPTTFYFPDEDGNFVVPISKEIPWAEGIARSTLEHMIVGEKSRLFLADTGLKAPFPQGTEILGLTIHEGLARVDFSKEFFDYPADEERLVITSLLYSLTEFPTVDRVELQVEGEKISYMPGGTVIGEVLTRDRGINMEVTDDLEDFRRVNRLILYFNTRLGQGQKHYFVPVTRIIPETDNLAEATISELLKGPRVGVPLYSAIPSGVELKDLSVREEISAVNLSNEFLGYRGGLEAGEHMLGQLVLSLTELPEVRQVQISVDGEATVLEDVIDLNQPYQRPGKINLGE